jgi:hypothetical protein
MVLQSNHSVANFLGYPLFVPTQGGADHDCNKGPAQYHVFKPFNPFGASGPVDLSDGVFRCICHQTVRWKACDMGRVYPRTSSVVHHFRPHAPSQLAT